MVIIILLTVTPLTASASPFFDRSHSVAGINKSRGQDEMIIYTIAFGDTTATNAYGYEIVVDKNGIIITVGGNNNAILPGGFVVSGHGDAADWLRLSVKPGMHVAYDTENVYFSYTADSVQAAATAALKATEQAIIDAKSQFIYADYATAENNLADCRKAFNAAVTNHQNGGSDAVFEEVCSQLLHKLTVVRNGLCNSYPVQYRGVWVRPSQSSADDVRAYVQTLYEAGINTVSVEGCFANSVIMEVPDDCLFHKNPAFSYDVLQAYIDACHEFGMECHLWMSVMKVGNNYDGDPSLNVLASKPQWACLDNHGSAENSEGFAMIDPANADARAYLVDFYRYIVENYAIDCLELDYIRYFPSSSDIDYGYTEAAFEGFEDAYGHGVTPTYDREAAYWNDWVQYRRDCVTAMVKEVRAMLNDSDTSVLLSADVAFPLEHALDRIYQEYPAWLDDGLLQILHPMAYGEGYAAEIRNAVEAAGDKCMVVTGLGVYTDSLGAAEMEQQAREGNQLGAYGEFYFEASSFLRDDAAASLRETVYRRPAITPYGDSQQSLKSLCVYMEEHIDNCLLPLGGVTAEEATAVREALAAVRASRYNFNTDVDAASLAALHDVIDTVKNEAARTALKQDIYRIEQIICVRHGLTAPQLQVQTTPRFSEAPSFLFFIMDIILVVIAVIGSIYTLINNRKQKAGIPHDNQTV